MKCFFELIGFGLVMKFVDSTRNPEYHQSYPSICLKRFTQVSNCQYQTITEFHVSQVLRGFEASHIVCAQ